MLAAGLVHYEGVANDGQVVTYQSDAAALPTKGTWLAGCHIILPYTGKKQRDPKVPAYWSLRGREYSEQQAVSSKQSISGNLISYLICLHLQLSPEGAEMVGMPEI